jgi:hypothetical protein
MLPDFEPRSPLDPDELRRLRLAVNLFALGVSLALIGGLTFHIADAAPRIAQEITTR